MSDAQLLKRISLNPDVMAGKPVIKGTRLTVEYILGLLAHGSTVEDVLEEYEGLTTKDIQGCMQSFVVVTETKVRFAKATSLEATCKRMVQDEDREAEALEFSEATISDVTDEDAIE
jgi:uncharacterized protein (DUF433 family)